MTIHMKVIFPHPLGLHARPIALWVKQIIPLDCEIRISKGSLEANGRSAISLLLLHVAEGDELIVTLEGSDEVEARNCFELWLKQL